MAAQRIAVRNPWALGDTVCLSALFRDVHRAYPKRFEFELCGHYKGLWKHDPHIFAATDAVKGRLIGLEYKSGIADAGRGLKKHFLTHFHRSFKACTGIEVPVTEPKGCLFLPPGLTRPLPERYWVVVAGGKSDLTAKVWLAERWQQVIDTLKLRGITCVQAGADHIRHFQPRLRNCISWLGKTDNNEFEFFSLIAHAEGVLCGVTGAMHIAAVYDKPCVVLAGGREEPWWEHYTNEYDSFGPHCRKVAVEHKFLHTLGVLDCGLDNLHKGCWRSKTVPTTPDDLTKPDAIRKLCRKPVRGPLQAVPECLHRISAAQVVENVLDYYRDGTIEDPTVSTEAMPDPAPVREELPLLQLYPREVVPKVPGQPNLSALDHPYLGGKVTICVLGCLDYVEALQRCLTSILDTVPAHRRDLRVALNQPSVRMTDYTRRLQGEVTKFYIDQGTRRKYPAMREMFWDEAYPITTKYLCWFDDDSWCKDKDWLAQLAACIIVNHGHGARLYGTRFIHDLAQHHRNGNQPKRWFEQARWWKNQWLHSAKGARKAPNGSQIVFVSGGFWALDVAAMRAADIPDVRLRHNGGDITIGEQINQAGFKIKDFSRGKRPVCWSDGPRRGFSEPVQWSKMPA